MVQLISMAYMMTFGYNDDNQSDLESFYKLY